MRLSRHRHRSHPDHQPSRASHPTHPHRVLPATAPATLQLPPATFNAAAVRNPTASIPYTTITHASPIQLPVGVQLTDAAATLIRTPSHLHAAYRLAHAPHHDRVPRRSHRRALHVQLETFPRRHASLVDCRRLRHRHGLPSAPHPSRLQNSEMDGIPPHHLRHPYARRRPHLLGGHPSQAPPEHRQGRRPALSRRRCSLGPCRLAYHRRNHAQRRR